LTQDPVDQSEPKSRDARNFQKSKVVIFLRLWIMYNRPSTGLESRRRHGVEPFRRVTGSPLKQSLSDLYSGRENPARCQGPGPWSQVEEEENRSAWKGPTGPATFALAIPKVAGQALDFATNRNLTVLNDESLVRDAISFCQVILTLRI
jgi:hypothetical protein